MNYIADDLQNGFWKKLEELEGFICHYGVGPDDNPPGRGSGRYPAGSGDNPMQHPTESFSDRIKYYKSQGLSDTQISELVGMKSTQWRRRYSNDINAQKLYKIEQALELRDKKGMGATEIGRELGVSEGTVRSWLKESHIQNVKEARATADMLKEKLAEFSEDGKVGIEVGKGIAAQIGITDTRLGNALNLLEEEGYVIAKGRMDQPTNPREGQKTTVSVLAPPGTSKSIAYDPEKIGFLASEVISYDGGETYHPAFQFPESMNSSRLGIRYSEQGGTDKDGLIELRRGVKDLDLGNSQYSQVRIMVKDKDGTMGYLKGMACYSDGKDWPEGVDVMFNTNKSEGKPALGYKVDADGNKKWNGVLKEPKMDKDGNIDRDNPFGSLIKEVGGQSTYTGSDGETHLSLINKRADEGDWGEWSKKLPAQFLAKQNYSLAEKQLKLNVDAKRDELDDILSVSNPTVRKSLLNDFAQGCDKLSVSLSAASLPGQKYQVLLPVPSLKDGEIYAPQFKDGTTIALVRFPHAGPFEIVVGKVNNKNKEAISMYGTDKDGNLRSPIDAIGIKPSQATQLSGADFDGDTALVIPFTQSTKISSIPAFSGAYKSLEGFDAKEQYHEVPGMKYMTKSMTGKQMGVITNLITDMYVAGAPEEHLVRAVKHSMVVIDAEKHKLNYKQSELDNGIDELKRLYQKRPGEEGKYGGATTLLSAAKSEARVPDSVGNPRINKETGELEYKTRSDLYYPSRNYNKETGIMSFTTVDGKRIKYDTKNPEEVKKYAPVKSETDSSGKKIFGERIFNADGSIEYRVDMRERVTTKMAAAKDARELISVYNSPMENLYAAYANSMKGMANEARKIMVNTKDTPRDSAAAKLFSDQVESIQKKIDEAEANRPKERAATVYANAEIAQKKKQYPELDVSHPTPEIKKELAKIRQRAMERARRRTGAKRISIKLTDEEWKAVNAGAISKTQLSGMLKYMDKDHMMSKLMPRTRTTISDSKRARIINLHNYNGLTAAEIAEAVGIPAGTVSSILTEAKNG